MLHYQFGIPFHIYVNPLRLNIFLPFSFSRKITLDQTLAPMCICNDTRSKSTQKKKEKKKSEVRRAQLNTCQFNYLFSARKLKTLIYGNCKQCYKELPTYSWVFYAFLPKVSLDTAYFAEN